MVQIIIGNFISQIKNLSEQQESSLNYMLIYTKKIRGVDKKYSFLWKNNTFLTGLLFKIVSFCKYNHIEYELIDNRTFNNVNKKKIEFLGQKREYQEVENLMLSQTRGIVKGATGSGKTAVMARFIAKVGLPTLIVVNSRDMMYQIKEEMEKFLGINDIGMIGSNKFNKGFITIATVQSLFKKITSPISMKNTLFESKLKKMTVEDKEYLYFCYKLVKTKNFNEETGEFDISLNYKLRNLNRKEENDCFSIWCKYGYANREVENLLNEIPVIFFDEMHHTAANTYKKVLYISNAYYRFGYSATPLREDMDSLILRGLFGKIIEAGDEKELIENGTLAKPYVFFIKYKSSNFSRYGGTYRNQYMKGLALNEERNKAISEIVEFFKDKKLLGLTMYKYHLDKVKEYVGDNGVEYLTGKDSTKLRNYVRNKFKEGDKGTILSTNIFSEGVDLPTLDILINIKGMKGKINTLQTRGRPMRGGGKCVIIDFLDEYSGILNKHSYDRMKIYKNQGDIIQVISLNELYKIREILVK